MQTYPPGTRIGQYEIASRPMMGGMGVVYFALDHGNDGRPVALKTFRPELLPDRAARDRFLREGTAWVELGNHPHIVRCYKVEYYDPTAFLVLELIAKEQNMPDASLRSWLIPGHPLSIEQALLFALQIARGMQYATEKIHGFVHRDLKPENILVGADKLPGTNINRLRVTDFGLAAIFKDETTDIENGPQSMGRTHLTNGILGTPLYMAPEQWKGGQVGVFTDVYELGCILYEMLTGKRAVEGDTLKDLQSMHTKGKLQPLLESLPGHVKDLLGRCLALAPDERYQDWVEITVALEVAYHVISGQVAPTEVATAQSSWEERKQEAASYNVMGSSYFHMGKAAVAVGYFEKSLHLACEVGDRQAEGAALGSLGMAYTVLGDARQAIGYCEQQLVIARETGDRRSEGSAFGNMGMAYAALGDARQAISYYEQSLAILREVGNRRDEGSVLGNIGNVHKNMGDILQAIEYYERYLTIACEIGDHRGEGTALCGLGVMYAALGNPRKAIGYYEQSRAIARGIGDRRSEGIALGNLGIEYVILGDASRAIGYFEQDLAIAREIGNLMGQANVCGNMATLHAQQGQPERALPLAQESERIFMQIGHTTNAQKARQLINRIQGGSGIPKANAIMVALQAFQQADSLQSMQALVTQYPFMKDSEFINAVQQFIGLQARPNLRTALQQQLDWLKQLANK